MKKFLSICILFSSLTSFAQTPEEAEVKNIVTEFFEAFHHQDTVALRELAHSTVTMQSLAVDPGNKNTLSTNTYAEFLQRIKSIPSTTKFEEKILSHDVRINGALATVIAPYTFHVNGNLSHCGVNSFTMVKEADEWKIVHIIDTRRKEGCNEV
ncbi:MAG TPA: nuclear transport factor 2 family protein [Gillisia sp.]|nr:nuclear transport factor 2 family protein [Gillisia sp.]